MKRPAFICKSHYSSPVHICNSLDHLLSKYRYVGYEAIDDERFFMVRDGEAYGLAVNPEQTHCSLEKQEKIKEGYFIFDTYEELFQWVGKVLI